MARMEKQCIPDQLNAYWDVQGIMQNKQQQNTHTQD